MLHKQIPIRLNHSNSILFQGPMCSVSNHDRLEFGVVVSISFGLYLEYFVGTLYLWMERRCWRMNQHEDSYGWLSSPCHAIPSPQTTWNAIELMHIYNFFMWTRSSLSLYKLPFLYFTYFFNHLFFTIFFLFFHFIFYYFALKILGIFSSDIGGERRRNVHLYLCVCIYLKLAHLQLQSEESK